MAAITRIQIHLTQGRLSITGPGFGDNAEQPTPALNPTQTIPLKDQPVALGDLADALIRFDEEWLDEHFDEAGQVAVGRYLYSQLFGDRPPHKLAGPDDEVALRISTADPDIARLPWVLLAHDAHFLVHANWSIALAPSGEAKDVELPPQPKLLVIAPQPNGWDATDAEEHIDALRKLLSSADLSYDGDECLRVVRDWPALLEALRGFQPDILYYYGHGSGDRHTTRLVFDDGEGGAVERPITDLIPELRNLPGGPPRIAYINCCHGDAGGLMGPGRQLGELIPAVVTNRTTAFIPAAQAQGIAFWRSVLLHGLAPDRAVTKMRNAIGGLGLTTADLRWMTPVIHCRYRHWKGNPPIPPSRSERDPNWTLKLDRVKQFGQINLQVGYMLKDAKPKALGYLWYGTQDQGLDVFHRRLNVELAENHDNTVLYQVKPSWPDDLNPDYPIDQLDPNESFSWMLRKAFQVNHLDDLGARIRTFGRQISGTRTLVYICHTPITSPLLFHPKFLRTYLQWWNHEFVPRLPHNAFGLLGISYEVNKPAAFQRLLVEQEHLDELTLDHAVFELLDELDRVTKRDLRAFVQAHNISLPDDLREEVLDEVMEETQGSYSRILDRMRELEQRAWRKTLEKKIKKVVEGDKDPYADVF